MPQAMRTDNGPPFASRAVAGLSRLAVWWIKLGILPERLAAGDPGENCTPERMHRAPKKEGAPPPAAHPRERFPPEPPLHPRIAEHTPGLQSPQHVACPLLP